MNDFSFANKRVLIMGLGLQGGGVGSAAFFARKGAIVTVTDLKTERELHPSLKLLSGLKINYVLGKHEKKDFVQSDLIIKNPDVKEDSPFLKFAQENNVPVEIEVNLFLRLSPAQSIGVTGTRGKSTVSKLIYEVLKANGKDVYLGGNMKGSRTLELLDRVNRNSWVVLELSSWQLNGLTSSPHLAIVTNLFPDHLNRYSSMNEYISDKKNIFRFQSGDDFLIINSQNEETKNFAGEGKGKVVFFRENDWPENYVLKIPGPHNRANAAAAWKTAGVLNLQNPTTRKAISEFPGLDFRIQTVGEIKGVLFVNDSTSTTPVATVAAIETFYPKGIVLLLGGNDKRLPLGTLTAEIKDKVKSVVLLKGSGTEELLKIAENDSSFKEKLSSVYDDYFSAIKEAFHRAAAGDVVLLSPGFTSFAMFNNEFERADLFSKYVADLKNEN